MKLLIKFPTRLRRDRFFSVLDLYVDYCEDKSNTAFIISMDFDDNEMNTEDVRNRFKKYEQIVQLRYYYGNNTTKVEAINADVATFTYIEHNDWDILLLASDDMIPQIKGYDNIIRNHMKTHFPDTDGCLWYDDGYVTHLNTLSIMGRVYYNRFNYIYHPSYKSLWCDNEYQEVFEKSGKYCHFDKVIIKHEHPNWNGGKNADLVLKNNDKHDPYDRENFKKRKMEGFPL